MFTSLLLQHTIKKYLLNKHQQLNMLTTPYRTKKYLKLYLHVLIKSLIECTFFISGRYSCPVLHRAFCRHAYTRRHQLDPAHHLRGHFYLPTRIALLLFEIRTHRKS